MSTIKGEVAFFDSRDVKSKRTGKSYTAYSIKLKLDDGSYSERLDAGFDPPKVSKGDYVEAEIEQNGQYWKLTSVKPAKRLPAVEAAFTGPQIGNVVAGDSGAADRQTQIVLQHSQEMAIQEVALLLEHDALPVSAAATAAGKAKRYSEIHAAIDKLTVQRFFDVVTARLLDEVADAGDVEVPVDGGIPPASPTTAKTVGDDD